MIDFSNMKNREKFLEEGKNYVLSGVEQSINDRLCNMYAALAAAYEQSLEQVREELREEIMEEFGIEEMSSEEVERTAGACNETIECADCPIGEYCPCHYLEQEGEEDEEDLEEDEEMLEEALEKDQDDAEDAPPSINITTRNLNPMQLAAIARFLEDFKKLGKTPKEKPAKK